MEYQTEVEIAIETHKSILKKTVTEYRVNIRHEYYLGKK